MPTATAKIAATNREYATRKDLSITYTLTWGNLPLLSRTTDGERTAVGLLFTVPVDIPQNSTAATCYLGFTTIAASNAVNAFAKAMSSPPAAFVFGDNLWTMPVGTAQADVIGAVSTVAGTPTLFDITPLIQERFNAKAHVAGDTIGIILYGNSDSNVTATIRNYDADATNPPELRLDWTAAPGAPNTPLGISAMRAAVEGRVWVSVVHDDTGASADQYVPQYKTPDSATWTTYEAGASATTTMVINGLDPGRYMVRAFARNAAGDSTPTPAVLVDSPPAPFELDNLATPGPHVITDLVNGQKYQVRGAAIDKAGTVIGLPTAWLEAIPLADASTTGYPTITVQPPASTSVALGAQATISATATGWTSVTAKVLEDGVWRPVTEGLTPGSSGSPTTLKTDPTNRWHHYRRYRFEFTNANGTRFTNDFRIVVTGVGDFSNSTVWAPTDASDWDPVTALNHELIDVIKVDAGSDMFPDVVYPYLTLEFTNHPGERRSQTTPREADHGINYYEGEEFWLGWSFYLPAGYPNPVGAWGRIMAEFFDGWGEPCIALRHAPDDSLHLDIRGGVVNGNFRSPTVLATVPREETVQIKMRVVARQGANGLVQVYTEDTLRLNNAGPNRYEGPSPTSFRVGMYGEGVETAVTRYRAGGFIKSYDEADIDHMHSLYTGP